MGLLGESKVRVSKGISIIGKQPASEDLKAVAEFLDREFNLDLDSQKRRHQTLNYKVVDADGTTYTFPDLKSLVESQHLTKEGLVRADFEYTNYEDGKGIDFTFLFPNEKQSLTNIDSMNGIRIYGMNEKWVKGSVKQIEELFSHWPQRTVDLSGASKSPSSLPKKNTIKPVPIEGKIIRSENIMRFSSIIWDEYKKDLTTAGGGPSFTISFTEEDGTSQKYENLDMMKAEGFLDTRKILDLDINYQNYRDGKGIHAKISHSRERDSYYNRINVSGEQRTWVEGIAGILQKEVTNFENQHWIRKPIAKFSISILISASIAFLILAGLVVYGNKSASISNFAFVAFFLIIALCTGIYTILAFFIGRLFPAVELQLGPDYQQREKIARSKVNRALGVLGTAVILPIIIGVLFLVYG